ncbi:MAG: hypothetical protein ABIG43_05105 [Chloroflexota bacterium]
MKTKWTYLAVLLILGLTFAGCVSTQPQEGNEIPMATPLDDEILADPDQPRFTDDMGMSLRVLWTVSGYVIGSSADWGETEADALLFKSLDISESEIVFNDLTCKNISFQEEIVDAEDYLADTWDINRQELGISDGQITVIKTQCDIPGFEEYVRLSDGRLVVVIHGVFFSFEPKREY